MGKKFCACILVRLFVTVSCLDMTSGVDTPCSNAAQNIRQVLDCPFSLNLCAAVCGSYIIIPRVSSAVCVCVCVCVRVCACARAEVPLSSATISARLCGSID